MSRELQTRIPDLQFVFFGDGIELAQLQETAKKRGLRNVKFFGRYPSDNMPQIFAWADILLLHLRDDPLFGITIPSKLQAYLASGRPVLAAVSGDAADIVQSAHAGLICPPSNPQALAETVHKFHSMSSLDRKKMGENGRHTACRLFSKKQMAEKIARMFEIAVKETKEE